MPTYPQGVWDQLKGITSQKLERALKRDGWKIQKYKGRQRRKGANTLTYRHPGRPLDSNKIVIHPHPNKTMGPRLLKGLLDCIGWTEQDMKDLKLIK